MKKIFFALSVLFAFASCKCKQNNATSEVENTQAMAQKPKSVCPDNGKCSVEIFRNQSLEVKTDDTGATYYNKIDNPKTSVILYKYDRNVPKEVQDANYSEQVVFEIPNDVATLNLSGQDLQQTKMLFGRFCFCRGAAGNFKVTEGRLVVNQKNKEVKFDLDFKITKVPQTINSFSEVIK
jgi:hypothetical protein